MTQIQIPEYSAVNLEEVSDINLEVEVVISKPYDSGEFSPIALWEDEARESLAAAISDRFLASGHELTVSDVRPSVPWHWSKYGHLSPDFEVPSCGIKNLSLDTSTHLEVVAIQTLKDAKARLQTACVCLHPVACLSFPFMPTRMSGALGTGTTAIRFCMFQRQSSHPVWAYAEWFHGGLDLNDPVNIKALVDRAHKHYRSAAAGR